MLPPRPLIAVKQLLNHMTTLYRKYRPAKWSDVCDQDHVQKTLQNEIVLSTIAHAYLFSGPRGVGKTTSARLLAKAINCTDRKKNSAEPCNACTSCIELNAGRHIDVMEIDAASQTGVDNVRENIIENAQFKPTKSAYKVFIIDEVHMLSNHAFNALLKTLEEPPAHAIFILATTELHKLPATVISRCQRFHFKKISYEPMLNRLRKIAQEEKISVEQKVFDGVIAKSDGCLRDAESLLGQIFSLNLKNITARDAELMLPSVNHEIVLNFIKHLTNGEPREAVNLLHAEIHNGQSPDQFALTLLELLRALLIIKMSNSTDLYRSDYSDHMLGELQNLAKNIAQTTLITMIELALKRRLDAKTSPLPQLPLELLAAEVVALVTGPTMPIGSPEIEKKTSIIVTPPKETIKSIVPTTKPSVLATTIEQIHSKWASLIEKISETNHSLTFILKMCTLKRLEHNLLVLGVPYSFHKEKVEELKTKRVIEQALHGFFQEQVLISCEIEEAVTAPPTADLTSLALAFGGEVVD